MWLIQNWYQFFKRNNYENTKSGKKLPINYTYVSKNEVGIAKIVSKCLWRKTAVRIRFFRLFKVTVMLEAVYNKSRVFCWKVLTLMRNLKKCLGSENVRKNIFLCLSISHCNILTHRRLGIPKIGWVKETSVITENLRESKWRFNETFVEVFLFS